MESIKKVALVTGASQPRGNGRAIALALAKQNIDVAVTGFSHMDGARAISEEIKKMGRKSMALQMDGRDYNSVSAVVNQVKDAMGPVNILVNNAGMIGHMVTIAKTTIEEWDNEVKTCLNSSFYCIKACWADMCAQKWGRIVNISSVAGVMGGYGQTSYGAAKAGLIGLAKSTALEGARYNITSNTVIIGVAQTESFYDILPEQVVKNVEKRTIWGKAAETNDIAGAVAYLVSDEAHYMTGATMNMLGGLDLFVF
jgi:3-oxoacyl-[acyl-carrier protein] reductase